jgi:hypothetical protein
MADVKDTVTARVRGWQDTIDGMEGSMLHGDAFNYLVKEISRVARRLDVEVISIRPDYARTNRPRENLPYVDARSVLEVAAPFDAVGEMVASLERLTPMLSVQLVQITGLEPPNHRAKFELSLLYMPTTDEESGEETPGDGMPGGETPAAETADGAGQADGRPGASAGGIGAGKEGQA